MIIMWPWFLNWKEKNNSDSNMCSFKLRYYWISLQHKNFELFIVIGNVTLQLNDLFFASSKWRWKMCLFIIWNMNLIVILNAVMLYENELLHLLVLCRFKAFVFSTDVLYSLIPFSIYDPLNHIFTHKNIAMCITCTVPNNNSV